MPQDAASVWCVSVRVRVRACVCGRAWLRPCLWLQYPELVAFHDFIAGLDGIKAYLTSPMRLPKVNANELG